jgi:flavin prenyltransferase
MINVAISGASGSILGIRLIEELLKAGKPVSCVLSETAKKIIEYEVLENAEPFTKMGALLKKRNASFDKRLLFDESLLREFQNDDFFAPMASGSSKFEAVIVIPCSMKTLSSIVNGYADCLIARMCDVAIKEKRKCLIVPRETPLSVIHTRNLHRAATCGMEIVMPVPGFYTRPKTVDDIIDFIIGKILNLLDIEHTLFKSWEYHDKKTL